MRVGHQDNFKQIGKSQEPDVRGASHEVQQCVTILPLAFHG
tara:strand:+ start:351 stop:473 length:123 start_codon:yes stop_codon:yes gene_type:complete